MNCSTVSVGDVVEVKIRVGWHGYVIPEFKREIKIVDPFSENSFQLMSGSNTYEYSGGGGRYQLTYLLKVIGTGSASAQLPKPRLHLDTAEIPLKGTDTTLGLQIIP